MPADPSPRARRTPSRAPLAFALAIALASLEAAPATGAPATATRAATKPAAAANGGGNSKKKTRPGAKRRPGKKTIAAAPAVHSIAEGGPKITPFPTEGATAFLTKPVSLDKLFETVRTFTQRPSPDAARRA